MVDYAVIQSGGKQYQVRTGDVIRVESIPEDEGKKVQIKDVLMVSQDGDVTIGTPNVTGATVTAEIQEHGKDKKITVFKYKAKTRYRRKQGHRQMYTELKVSDIKVRKSRKRS